MNPDQQNFTHATGVAIGGHGLMICGPSGSGKSDLALRLIDRGAILVSDDIVSLSVHDRTILMDSPAAIRGKIELRSLGILEMPCVRQVPLSLKIDLKAKPERFPVDNQKETILGLSVRRVALCAFEPSTPIKVEMALEQLIRLKDPS
ncbi:HPr kinase/phosphatase C-terminal domain-containing protein [Parasphingorhabdus sp.]|uniref:HPr kinase/phosphorylase n=1 Tax=Parasphingorhabdus sp. TaxID=2709688 RepID=UPI00326423E7